MMCATMKKYHQRWRWRRAINCLLCYTVLSVFIVYTVYTVFTVYTAYIAFIAHTLTLFDQLWSIKAIMHINMILASEQKVG